jgi:hypothetical protein
MALVQLVTDVNIAVAVEAVQAIGNLASGLRKDFTPGSKLLLPVLLVSLSVFLYSRFVAVHPYFRVGLVMSSARNLMLVLQDKLKEKKQVMVDALTTTLNAMHKGGCIALLDVIEGKLFLYQLNLRHVCHQIYGFSTMACISHLAEVFKFRCLFNRQLYCTNIAAICKCMYRC